MLKVDYWVKIAKMINIEPFINNALYFLILYHTKDLKNELVFEQVLNKFTVDSVAYVTEKSYFLLTFRISGLNSAASVGKKYTLEREFDLSVQTPR